MMDFAGKVFSSWTVIGSIPVNRKVMCRCACGFEKDVRTDALTSGKSKCCQTCHHEHNERFVHNLRASIAAKRGYSRADVLAQIDARKTMKEICEHFQCDKQTVYSIAKENGRRIFVLKTGPWTDEAVAKLRELWPVYACREIGEKLGVSRSAAISKAHSLGLPTKQARPEHKTPAVTTISQPLSDHEMPVSEELRILVSSLLKSGAPPDRVYRLTGVPARRVEQIMWHARQRVAA